MFLRSLCIAMIWGRASQALKRHRHREKETGTAAEYCICFCPPFFYFMLVQWEQAANRNVSVCFVEGAACMGGETEARDEDCWCRCGFDSQRSSGEGHSQREVDRRT